MNSEVRQYLAEIGCRGGQKSRRTLTSEDARRMTRIRDARRAFERFHTECFWSYDPARRITGDDVEWVAETLMRHGGREAWEVGARLCR